MMAALHGYSAGAASGGSPGVKVVRGLALGRSAGDAPAITGTPRAKR